MLIQNTTTKRLTHSRTRNRLLLHSLLKSLQRQLRRIIRYLMPRAKNPQPTQIPNALERASRFPINRVATHRFRFESRGAGIGDGFCSGETTEPIAYPVGVTGPD